jgi:molecular chaperone GrpE
MQEQDPAKPDEPTDAAPEQPEPEISPPSLEELLEEAAREREQFRALAQRGQADLINYKRRVEEERQALAQNASIQIVVRLLPILDDFQRALEHLPEDAPDSWTEGIQMVQRKLDNVLDAEGVVVFSPEAGVSFDPSEHEAVYFGSTDQYPPGSVISTARPGYRNAVRVLRPAQVVLAQAPEEETDSEAQGETQ